MVMYNVEKEAVDALLRYIGKPLPIIVIGGPSMMEGARWLLDAADKLMMDDDRWMTFEPHEMVKQVEGGSL